MQVAAYILGALFYFIAGAIACFVLFFAMSGLLYLYSLGYFKRHPERRFYG